MGIFGAALTGAKVDQGLAGLSGVVAGAAAAELLPAAGGAAAAGL